MLTYKLVHLVQYYSDDLAAGLVRQVQTSERTGSYRNVPAEELQKTVHEIYQHLGAWLIHKGEKDWEMRYLGIGARRAEQKVPLAELIWVIVLTRRNLCGFIEDISLPGRAADGAEKEELLALVNDFFDQAIYAAILGYKNPAAKSASSNLNSPVPGAKARKGVQRSA